MEFEIIIGTLLALSLVCFALALWLGYQGGKAKARHDEVTAALCGSLERIFTVLLCVCLIHMLGFSQLDRVTTGFANILAALEGLK